MAVFSQLTAGDISSIDDMQKVRDYLYKLNKNLRYMFNNLTPEDNYSESARLILVQDGERQASIETSLEGIVLSYVSKDNIVSSINLSEEMIQIAAEKIRLEGLVTVNGYFKVGLDGSIEAKNGHFSGSITGSDISLGGSQNDGFVVIYNSSDVEVGRIGKNGVNINNNFIVNTAGVLTATGGNFSGNISGSTITGSHIYSSYYGTTADDFFITADGDDTIVGITGFTWEDQRMYSDWIGSVENPALGDDTAGINGATGDAGFRKLYLLDDWYEGSDGTFWDVTRTLKWLDNRISAIESECWQHCADSDDCDCQLDADDCPGDADDCIGDGCSGDACPNVP